MPDGLNGSNFVFRLQEALERAGKSVFCYANMHGPRRWLHPLLHGAPACRVFMPVCSPQYGDLDAAPWGAAELLHAAAAADRGDATGGAAGDGGGPAILPVWHSGAAFPPNEDTESLLRTRDAGGPALPAVPDAHLYGYGPEALGMGGGGGAASASARGARAMPLQDVFVVVLDALERAQNESGPSLRAQHRLEVATDADKIIKYRRVS